VHQVGPKDSGSQNFSFLASKASSVASRQISSNTATAATAATARDRRKIFYRSNHVIYS
jgi:hypothetical protein